MRTDHELRERVGRRSLTALCTALMLALSSAVSVATASVLLVDEDDDTPDVRGAYTSTLTSRPEYSSCDVPQTYDGAGCDIWDVSVSGEPVDEATLGLYDRVIWFSGDLTFGAGPGTAAENALQAYLEGGGCLILSSENYVSDAPSFPDLTPFMTNYLGLSKVGNDSRVSLIESRYRFSGLQPFDPTSNGAILENTDQPHPDFSANARSAFTSDLGSVAVYNEQSSGATIFRTLTLGFSFDRLAAASASNLDRAELLDAALQFCDTGLRAANADSDGDGVPDALDAFPLNGAEARDFDDDGIGDASDDDDDDDGLPDIFETDNGLNPRHARDALLDNDGDGYSNRIEYRVGTDLGNAQGNEIPQEFTLLAPPYDAADDTDPGDVDAWVLFEWIGALDPAIAYRLCVYRSDTTVYADVEQPAGQHIAYLDFITNFLVDTGDYTWTVVRSVDSCPGAPSQPTFTVIDEFNGGSNPSGEGEIAVITGLVQTNQGATNVQNATVRVTSDVHIPRLVNEGRRSHIAVSDELGRFIVLGLNTQTPIALSATSPGFNPGEANTVYDNVADLFRADFPDLEALGGNTVPTVELEVSQNGGSGELVFADQSTVRIVATVSDPDTGQLHTFDWSATDDALTPVPGSGGTLDDNFWFDPAALAPGFYTVSLTVTDDGDPAAGSTAESLLRLRASPPSLSAVDDTDGDGIPDAAEGYADTDGDRIPEYLDVTNDSDTLQLRTGDPAGDYEMRVLGGRLRIGETAFRRNARGALITQQDLDDRFGSAADTTHTHVGGIYDVEIIVDGPAGSVAELVVPLLVTLPAKAEYRKFAGAWFTFIENAANQVHSASGSPGRCPPATSPAYTAGLTEGHLCVKLTIQDGGPNDADGSVNGVIKDPGTVGFLTSAREDGDNNGDDSDSTDGGGGGGGALRLFEAMALWLILLLALQRRSSGGL